ncbi:CBS domain-containing protein [Candidatus Albibeggiatoa sp. nov. NOAA]|uniref:CBS domain-containing protein n=1 Tax=Candidatus Albibeggiatoa sp. nov. NOAA TaxID=3162724 RepID=UPI0032FDAA25|nr:CBS domain-containing protein [Thiotrichaceae bacterium]
MTMRTLLEGKSQETITVSESEMMLSAVQKMVDAKVGALLVTGESQSPMGILTERDVLRFCGTQADKLASTPVVDVMTKDLVVGTLDTSVDEAQVLMTQHKFRHLPVIDEGKVIGIVSIGDLVKARLRETAVEVKYLRDFIAMN